MSLNNVPELAALVSVLIKNEANSVAPPAFIVSMDRVAVGVKSFVVDVSAVLAPSVKKVTFHPPLDNALTLQPPSDVIVASVFSAVSRSSPLTLYAMSSIVLILNVPFVGLRSFVPIATLIVLLLMSIKRHGLSAASNPVFRSSGVTEIPKLSPNTKRSGCAVSVESIDSTIAPVA